MFAKWDFMTCENKFHSYLKNHSFSQLHWEEILILLTNFQIQIFGLLLIRYVVHANCSDKWIMLKSNDISGSFVWCCSSIERWFEHFDEWRWIKLFSRTKAAGLSCKSNLETEHNPHPWWSNSECWSKVSHDSAIYFHTCTRFLKTFHSCQDWLYDSRNHSHPIRGLHNSHYCP